MWFCQVGVCGFSKAEYVGPTSGSDQLLLSGHFYRLGSLVNQQFTIDILDVKLDCVQAEAKLLPDLFIALPGSQAAQHIDFPVT